MNRSIDQLWMTLHQAGLAASAAPESRTPASPWYVKVLLAFSGWLAAFFLLGFIAMGASFVIENHVVALITGGLMIGGAFFVLRVPGNEFLEHLALAVSLAGQALVVFVIFDTARRQGVPAWLGVFVLEALLAALIPNFVHRVFSSFIAAISFTRMLAFLGCPHIAAGAVLFAAALCWLNEFRYPTQIKRTQALGYGLVLALVLLKGTTLLWYHGWWWPYTGHLPAIHTAPWMGEALIGAVAVYLVWHLLRRYGQDMSAPASLSALLGVLVVCLVSMKVQGLTVGMVILLLGFAGANRVLMGLGIVSLLFYISSYYYLLEVTLLAKSLTLLLVGLVLLSLRALMRRMIPAAQETTHV